MSVLQQLRAAWGLISGRWHVFELERGPDWDEATQLLASVRAEELRRAVDGDPWASPAFAGQTLPFHAFAVRQGRDGPVVGVIQCTEVRHLLGIAPTVQAYALERIGPDLAPHSLAVLYFALSPDVRKSTAGLALLAGLGRFVLAQGFSAAVFVAEPAQLPRYLQLGARALAPMRASAYGGFRIPLVLLMADRARLDAVNSPLRWLYETEDIAGREEGLAWLRQFEQTYGHIDTGVAAYHAERDQGEQPAHALLSRGMNEAEVQALVKGSLVLEAHEGDRILARGGGGAALGVVLAGVVQVMIGERVIAALGPGEPFGEIAFVTGEPRSADLMAASPGTRLLQFSPTALATLPPAAALTLWRNLAWCLAHRLVERTSN